MSRKWGRALDPVKNEALLGRQPERFSLFSFLVFFVCVFTNIFACYCLGNHSEGIETRFEQIRRGMRFLRNRKQKDFAFATFQVWRREISAVQYQVKISNFATRRGNLGDARFEIRDFDFSDFRVWRRETLGLATRSRTRRVLNPYFPLFQNTKP